MGKGARLFALIFLPFLLSGCLDDIQVLLPYDDQAAVVVAAPEPEEDLFAFMEEEEIPEELVEEEEAPIEEELPEEKPRIFSPGTVEGLSYENLTLGLGLTMDPGWTYSTEEELAELNGLSEPATVDSATAFLAEPQEYIDMDVISGGIGNEISISVINSMFIASEDMAQVAEDTSLAIEEQLSDEGYEDIQVGVEERLFLGEVVFTNVVSCNYQGTQVSEMQIHSEKNGYFFTVTLMFFGDDLPDDVMGNFYEIDGEMT